MEYNKYIDHTLLKQDASEAAIKHLCQEAREWNFKSVCINPFYLDLIKKELKGTEVLACTVIGFPLGQMTTASKVFETEDAIKHGADEIDMVINISKLKADDRKYCIDEINAVKKACQNRTLKVIVETCLLTNEEIKRAAEIVLKTNADFIKTSTGFSTSGATLEGVKIFKSVVGDKKLIKAAGGVRSHADLIEFIAAGADRIGTSSGVKLMK